MTGSQGSYVEDIYEKPASQFKLTNLERWKYTRDSLAYYSNDTNQSVVIDNSGFGNWKDK
jgi:hypothetical protein